MRLAIDTWDIAGSALHTGMGQYTKTLLVGTASSKIEVVAFGGPRDQRPEWLPANVEWVRVGRELGRWTGIDSRVRLVHREVERHGIDVFHTPGVHVRPSMPPVASPGVAHVVTVHDVIPLTHYRQSLPVRNRMYYRWNLNRALRADRVITVSRAARFDIAAATGISRNAISVVTSAVDFPPNRNPNVLEPYGITRPYALVTGSCEPRKNLIDAMRGFDRYAAEGGRLDLVATTDPGSGHESAVVAVRDTLQSASRITFIGNLPRADLRAVYSHARVVLMPSTAEGFGLPVVEALSCGVPVVVSPLKVYDETVGDLAKRVDPKDHLALGRAIDELDNDSAWRARVRREGPRQAAVYSPEHCVDDHLAVYQELKEHRHAMA